jgi:pimeloyl-ACP methyl ester carboxylesterase
MATSIGANMAWALAAAEADRVMSLVCINIPHPGAIATASANVTSETDDQNAKFSYIKAAQKEGNERAMFEAMLARQGVSVEESAPYRQALDSDEALRCVFNFYRAIPLWARDRIEPVSMPSTFIWPTGSENVSSAAVEALPDWVTGPFRCHVVKNVHQPALQAAPEQLTALLLDHLTDHATIAG